MTKEETSRRQAGRTEGAERSRRRDGGEKRREKFRRSALQYPVASLSPRCDIRAEKVAVSFRTLKYIRQETERTGKLCESERRSLAPISRGTRYSLAASCSQCRSIGFLKIAVDSSNICLRIRDLFCLIVSD